MTPPRADFAEFQSLVRDRLGLDPARAGQTRLMRALQAASTTLADRSETAGVLRVLADKSIRNPAWQAAISELTIRETSFFRQRDWIYAIRDEILVPLIERRRQAGHRFAHVLSVGTANGAEAYTLAMLLHMLTAGEQEKWHLQVVGTDLSEEALDEARRGRYRVRALREVPAHLRSRYFSSTGEENTLAISPRVQELVRFELFNLANWIEASIAAQKGSFDLILCRNVLMYLEPSVRDQAADRLADQLTTEGWMLLSPAESAADLSRKLKRCSLGPLLAFSTTQTRSRANPGKAESKPAALAGRAEMATAQPAVRTLPPRPPAPLPVMRHHRSAEKGADADPARDDALDPSRLLDAATNAESSGADGYAVSLLRRVLYLEPGNAEAHFRLGGLLHRTGRPDQGRRHDRSALACLGERSDDELLRQGQEIRIRQVRKALAERLG